MIIDTKYFRLTLYINSCPSLHGSVGVYYDSYREIEGPETFDICLYFFGFTVELGPRFVLDDEEPTL